MSKKVGYLILEALSPDETLATKEYDLDNRNVVIFDHGVNEPTLNQKKITNHYTDSRQHNISHIYLSQSYYDVSSNGRHNTIHLILYHPTTKRHYDFTTKKNRVELTTIDTLRLFEFLLLDKETKKSIEEF